MKVRANAKINLGLNVVSKRSDGYHNLESLFVPIALADEIEITEATGKHHSLQCTGVDAGCASDDNLVMRAAALVDVPPVDIVLHKEIPTGAGLGGGSSDAAATLKALNVMFGLGMTDDEMRARLRTLGADCPFFVANTMQFAEGIGDILTPLAIGSTAVEEGTKSSRFLSGTHIVVVKPCVAVSTREAYAGITPRAADIPILFAISEPMGCWRDSLRNDFEATVFCSHPEIAAVKKKLYDLGAVYAQMSGSGASVFGLFKDKPSIAKHTFPVDYFVWNGTL